MLETIKWTIVGDDGRVNHLNDKGQCASTTMKSFNTRTFLCFPATTRTTTLSTFETKSAKVGIA